MNDRDRLVELYERAKEEYAKLPIVNGSKVDFNYFIADHLTENGVTIPVRCRECVYCKHTYPYLGVDKKSVPVWYCKEYGFCVEKDDYCSYGERKENDDE